MTPMPLWMSCFSEARRSRKSPASINRYRLGIRSVTASGIPMSILTVGPPGRHPGNKLPYFGVPEGDGQSAWTATPITWPVSEFKPDGTSIAVTGFFALLRSSMTRA